jgi:hypothetical protein
MKSRLPEILAGLSILTAIALVVHQKIVHGFWIILRDAWHHESVEAGFIAIASGLLLGKFLAREPTINRLSEIFAGVAILVALLLLLHKKLIYDVWFNWHSSWHHESVEACFLALAMGLLLGKYLGRINKE